MRPCFEALFAIWWNTFNLKCTIFTMLILQVSRFSFFGEPAAAPPAAAEGALRQVDQRRQQDGNRDDHEQRRDQAVFNRK